MTPSDDLAADLVRFHELWRRGGCAATFAAAVAERYELSTLAILLKRGSPAARRSAVTALGMLADDGWSHHLGSALADPARMVRLEAHNWIGRLWNRVVPAWRRGPLAAARRRVVIEPREVLMELETWERVATRHAVVWQLRGDALVRLGHDEEAGECYRIAGQIDPFRYPAFCAQAELLRRAQRIEAALGLYRRALRVHPDLARIRAESDRLEKLLR